MQKSSMKSRIAADKVAQLQVGLVGFEPGIIEGLPNLFDRPLDDRVPDLGFPPSAGQIEIARCHRPAAPRRTFLNPNLPNSCRSKPGSVCPLPCPASSLPTTAITPPRRVRAGHRPHDRSRPARRHPDHRDRRMRQRWRRNRGGRPADNPRHAEHRPRPGRLPSSRI